MDRETLIEKQILRTIFIHPIGKLTREDVDSHFEQFGSVEFVSVKKKSYCVIRFGTDAPIVEVLKAGKQIIKGVNVKVESAYYRLRSRTLEDRSDADTSENINAAIDNVLLPPDEESPLNIINKLNDDCLTEIFQRLPLRDLCSVAETCTRFKKNAQMAFLSRFAYLNLDYDSDIISYLVIVDEEIYFDDIDSIPQTERLFRNFGKFIKSINLKRTLRAGDERFNRIMTLIATYCSDENSSLIELKQCSSRITDDVVEQLCQVFAHLKRLDMNVTNFTRKISKLLGSCHELIELQLSFTSSQNYSGNDDRFGDEILNQMFESNRNIRKLELFNSDYDDITTDIYRCIGSNLQALEYLHVYGIIKPSRIVEQDFIKFGNLKNLKELHLNCSGLPVIPILNVLAYGKVSIEVLSLSNFNFTRNEADSLSKLNEIQKLTLHNVNDFENGQLARSISGMPYLKKIKFDGVGLKMSEIKEITKIAQELSSLRCDLPHECVIDENDFNSIAKTVKNRKNNIKLVIDILSKVCTLDVPINVIKMNREWLEIHKLFGAISECVSE